MLENLAYISKENFWILRPKRQCEMKHEVVKEGFWIVSFLPDTRTTPVGRACATPLVKDSEDQRSGLTAWLWRSEMLQSVS